MIRALLASPRHRLMIGCSAVAALALTLLMLWGFQPAPPPALSDTSPVEPRPVPPGLDAERLLFQPPPNPESVAPPTDAPVLAGIVGRLPDNAVAMVRDDDGRTRIVAIGQQHRGWRLESLSGDAAFFTRGNQRVRVALPLSVDDEASALDQ